MWKKIIFLMVFLTSIGITSAFSTASENFNSSLIVIDSGGTNVSSENFASILAIGQIATANVSSANYNTQFEIFPYRFLEEAVAVITPTPEAPSGGGGGGVVLCPTNQTRNASGFCVNITNVTIQRYDVLVKVEKNIYKFNETVKAEITLENMGDIPDEDTVLIYFLSNPINREFGFTREQLIEPVIGKNTLIRNLTLPEDELTGEWRFNVRFFTKVQPTIDVADTFRVKEELTFIDTLKNIRNPLESAPFVIVLILISIFIYYHWKKDFERRKKGDSNG